MKKSLLLITCVCLSFGAFSQVTGGFKGGLNIATQKAILKFDGNKISATSDPRIAFHLGAYLNVPIADQFSFQPELLFSSLGAKNEEDGISYESKANYVSVPLLFKYNPIPVFNIHAGPQFGVLVAAKDKIDGEETDAKDGYKTVDVGLGFGVGVDIPGGVNLTMRYVLGIANIVDEDIEGLTITGKNNVFQFSVGYRLFGTTK